MPAGRPEIPVTDEMLQQIESFAAQGLTKEQVARCIGIGPGTFYEKQKKYPEMKEAFKNGKAKGIGKVTNKLFELCNEGNLGAICFYLKNRDYEHWSENRTQDKIAKKNGNKYTINVTEIEHVDHQYSDDEATD